MSEINPSPVERTVHEMSIIIYIYMVFTTDGFFEVAIESWP